MPKAENINMNHLHPLAMAAILALMSRASADRFDEDTYGVKYADECEVCKIVTNEIELLLSESAKKSEVIETGYSVERKKKKTKYVKSELRLVETMEEVCERILKYNIHKERKDWTRFARGQSETFRTLEGLVAKGVKVDIGIPQDLWSKPSAEITHLKTQCEQLVENHEEKIESWYFNHQEDDTLGEYLCRKRVLKGKKDKSCLDIKGDHLELENKKTEL